MALIDGGLPLPSGDFQITSLPGVPVDGEVTILPFPLPGDDGVVTFLPYPGEDVFTILPFPMPGDDDVFTIQPFPMPGDDGVVTIMPYPMPGDDDVFTILPFPEGDVTFMPVLNEGFFAVNPLKFDFDFSALTFGSFEVPTIDWSTLLPVDLMAAEGFGFQSFAFNTDGGLTLTLLDGSFLTVAVDQLAAISFPSIEEGRLAIDPSTLTGSLLDGFNAGWI